MPPDPPAQPRRRPARRTAPPVHVEYHLLLLLTLGLVAFGLIMVYSASSGLAVVQGQDPIAALVRQGSYALAGILCMAGATRFSYRHLRVAGPFLMLAALIGLILVKVPGIGLRLNGAERWIAAGPITIQASEFAKLAVVVLTAAVLAARKRPPRTVKELVNPIGVLTLVVCGLVALEPDLGTTIAIAVTCTGMRYRRSDVAPGEVVAEAVLELRPDDPDRIRRTVSDMQRRRREAQPAKVRTFGSVWKNPDPERTAGRLLEECGLKGYAVGGARISPVHANFIENHDGARSADVIALMGYVPPELAAVGTEIEIDARGRPVAARVASKPLYVKEKVT